jgi:hypothetical protein
MQRTYAVGDGIKAEYLLPRADSDKSPVFDHYWETALGQKLIKRVNLLCRLDKGIVEEYEATGLFGSSARIQFD